MSETSIYLRVRGQVLRVNGRSAVLGRSKSCDVQLDEQGVSRRHCEITLRDDGASVRDLGSTHGTWVDGRRIAAEERVRAGAVVRLGAHGPHFELVNAIVHGRPVLGVTDAAASPHVGTVDTAKERTTVAVAERPPEPAAPPAPAPSRFVAGLAWGVVAGLLVGVLVLALVDVGL
jgi:predicted component of type VI protein secretion system